MTSYIGRGGPEQFPMRWWERRRSHQRMVRRQGGEELPVPCDLRRTYAGRPTRPRLLGTLDLGDPPVWTSEDPDLTIALDPATWRLVGVSDEPAIQRYTATAVVSLEADGDRFDLIVHPDERPAVIARFS